MIPKFFKIAVLILITGLSLLISCNPANEVYKRFKPDIENAKPPVYLGEPPSNAGTNLLKEKDGSLNFIFRKGDWHHGGFSDEVYSMKTYDEGRTWSNPEILLNTGKGSQCFATISPVSDEVILFYGRYEKNYSGNYHFVRTSNNRKDWSYNRHLSDVRFNGVGYGNCLWIDLPNGKKRVLTGVHGDKQGAGCYYSDDDGKTWKASNRSKVPDLIPNIWQTGSVEPSFIELNDGRIWMVMRNSNDRLWQSFSTDKGETWSKAMPTNIYCGPNSWITLKRLSTGEILMVWNNAMSPHPSMTSDKWNFLNRDLLHVAISSDEGKNWTGFRELWLDRMRNSSEYANHPGDKGMNESKVAETKQGNVLIACGQAPKHRAFILLDPDWIYQKSNYNDFSDGLKQWSVQKIIYRSPQYTRKFHYNYNRKQGAKLIDHPDKNGKKVLHIRCPHDTSLISQRDGAVWNFPSGKSGNFETRIMLKKGFKGASIHLNDRWFQPTDYQGRDKAMFSLTIPANGTLFDGSKMEKEKWNTIKMEWKDVDNRKSSYCYIYLNGVKLSQNIPLKNISPHGISYVRFRSDAMHPDKKGIFVEYVKSNVK